jgi:hypothetical protein
MDGASGIERLVHGTPERISEQRRTDPGLIGLLLQRRLWAAPDEVLCVLFSADQDFLVFIHIQQQRQPWAIQPAEVEEAAVLAKWVAVVAGIERRVDVAKKQDQAAVNQMHQAATAFLVDFAGEHLCSYFIKLGFVNLALGKTCWAAQNFRATGIPG